MMEVWDLLDREGNPLGRTHIRGEELPKGVYHRTVEIFTVNSRGELLVTLRSPDKDAFPDLWEVTGGSVIAGEDSLTAAKRELREETGLAVSEDEIQFLMTNPGTTALMDIYLVRKDADIADLTMQPGETVAAKWITFPQFECLIDEGQVPEPVYRRYFVTKELLLETIFGHAAVIQ